MKTPLLASICAAGLLGGCATPAQTTAFTAELTLIGNAATPDLNRVIAVANAATPPAPHLSSCATGVLTVAAAMKQVQTAAAPSGAAVGPFTTAAVLSLYQPGSAQFQYAVTTIQTACIAEATDVLQAGASTAGLPAAIGAALAIALPKPV
jgi:hypothetical protein